jgi:hypothetical protein
MVKVSHLLVSAGIATAVAVAMAAPAGAAVTWIRIATPDAAASDFDQLMGTAVVSSSEAWSVGITHGPSDTELRPLIEHWTSARGWQVTPSAPIVSGTDARVVAVAGTSATDVWAVGQLGNVPAVDHGLFEHWNGSAWSRVNGPAAEPGDSTLAGVATISSTDAWAVGQQINPTSLQSSPLFEHWNGSAWSVVASPNGSNTVNTLAAVSVLGASDVWAVGLSTSLGVFSVTVTEHWDGTSWSVVPSPNGPSGSSTQLLGVAGHAGGPLLAVGNTHTSDGIYHAFGISG